jgi:hypothetical protein
MLVGFFLLLSILAYFGKVFTHGNDAEDPQRGDPFHPFTFGSHSQSTIQQVRQVRFETELMAGTHGVKSQLRAAVATALRDNACIFS